MSALRQALDDYLVLRQALGFKLRDAPTLLPQFVAFLEEQQADGIPTAWALQWATPPAMSNPPRGPEACAWSVALRSTKVPSIPGQKFQRRSCYRSAISVVHPISTAKPTSPSALRLPANCLHPRVCGLGPTPPGSGCLPSPGCGSAKWSRSIMTMSISKPVC